MVPSAGDGQCRYTVVNVGGMSHTGSTVLGRIIANDDGVMLLGEIESLFRPTRKHHYEHIRMLSKTDTWPDILQCGVHGFYARMLDKFEGKDTLVDCSKSPLWISARNSDCQKMGIRYRNVLIYKTPYEMAQSYNARKKNWVKTFENYFRRYFCCVDEFYIIAYRDLVESRPALKGLCAYLGIRYFDTKKNYWENRVAALFGSEKANTRSSLTYQYNLTSDQEEVVTRTLREYPTARKLWTVLESHRNRVCSSQAEEFKGLCARKSALVLWAAANRAKKRFRGVFPEDYFKKRIVQ